MNIYVIETNYLAARYLHMLLSERSINNLQIIEDGAFSKASPLDTSSCLLVMDQSSLSADWFSYGRTAISCFPHSRLILVGTCEFGDRLQRAFPGWLAEVLDYANVERLSAAVVRAASVRPRETESSAMEGSLGLTGRLAQLTSLSKRESEIFELVRLQLSNKEIANRLNIAEVTVKFHVSNAFAKMGLRRRRELFQNS
jgi:DNA-binding CsgD family transcriptional regulator